MQQHIPRSIIDILPESIYWMDKEGKVVGCNKNQADIFGFSSPEDIKGKNIFDVGEKLGWEKSTAHAIRQHDLEIMATQKEVVVEEKVYLNGEPHYVLSFKHPWINEHNEVQGIIGISLDITQRKHYEIELKKAKNNALAASRAKSDFLANMSHDLRTPLSNLVALTQYVADNTKDPKLNSLLTDAHLCADQVMYLIDEMLEVAEIDSGNIQSKKKICDLEELCQSVFRLMKPAASQKAIQLELQFDTKIPKSVVTNCNLIHRILMNLTSNAIKFTDSGKVLISTNLVNSNKNDELLIRFTVKDTGIGIAKENFEKIFDQFERLSSSYEGRYQGRGLGLYIVKQFIKVLNASIEIDSAEGVGSSFHLLVPVSLPQGRHLPKSSFKNYGLANPPSLSSNLSKVLKISEVQQESKNQYRILLIEDNKVAQTVGMMALDSLVNRIEIADNGQKAIELFSKDPSYDLILLDIGLPDVSGFEVARKIRTFEIEQGLTATPIIALTAHLKLKNSHEALAAGIQQIMLKPLTPQKAHAVLANWLMEISGTPQQSQKPQKNTPTIDLHSSAKLVGSRELALTMLNDFVITLPDFIDNLNKSYASNNMEALKGVVHNLNGGSSYAGVHSLKRACNSLEAAINDDFESSEIADLYKDLLHEIQEVMLAYDEGEY